MSKAITTDSALSRLLILVTATLLAAMAATPAFGQMQITYTGNAGVLLTSGEDKVLIDSLQNHTNNFWVRLPQPDLDAMIDGVAPFDSVDFALVTHNHPDHFNSTRVRSFLGNNPDASFIGPPQVRSVLGPHEQSLDVSPEFQNEILVTGASGIEVEVLHMEHFDQFGNDFSRVENFSYLVTMGDVSLLHLGDVDFIEENFENFDLANRGIDAVVLPAFNTLLTESNRELIIDQINPRHIIAAHLRAGQLASETENVRRIYPDATIFTEPLASITLNPVPEPQALPMLLIGLFFVRVAFREKGSRRI